MNPYPLLCTILHFKREVLERHGTWIIKIDGDVDVFTTKRFQDRCLVLDRGYGIGGTEVDDRIKVLALYGRELRCCRLSRSTDAFI